MDEIPAAGARPWLAIGAEVTALLGEIDPSQFDRLVEELGEGDRRWFFSGQGRSGFVARMAAMRLMHIGRTVHVQGDATTPAIRAGDAILFVSGSGETRVTLHFAEIARREEAQIVVLTRKSDSTLARLADVVVRLPVQDSRQLGGSLFEQCALLVLDAAIMTVGAREGGAKARLASLHTNLL